VKKKKGGHLEKAPHCAGVGIPFFVGISLSKCPTTRQRIKKKKPCWVNVPSNYTKKQIWSKVLKKKK
jgi:hypothetical protein